MTTILDFVGANVWMVFYAMFATIFIGAFFWALGVLASVYNGLRRRFMRTFVWGPQRRRTEEMILRARNHGPAVVRNRLPSGMVGVCSFKDYKAAKDERNDKAAKEPSPEIAGRLFVDSPVIVPTKIYTFTDSHFQQWFHTGTKAEGELIAEQIVFEITGFRKDQVDSKGYREATSVLVVDDARLFVPFCRELPELPYAEQLIRFGYAKVADAMKSLLEDIRNP